VWDSVPAVAGAVGVAGPLVSISGGRCAVGGGSSAYAPKNSLSPSLAASSCAAWVPRRSRPRPVAGRRTDISKAPEEVVPLEPNGLRPCT
jgi:hypothetical protein